MATERDERSPLPQRVKPSESPHGQMDRRSTECRDEETGKGGGTACYLATSLRSSGTNRRTMERSPLVSPAIDACGFRCEREQAAARFGKLLSFCFLD